MSITILFRQTPTQDLKVGYCIQFCFATDSVSVATTYNNMGAVFDELGDYEKALFHYQKALDIKIQSHGGATNI